MTMVPLQIVVHNTTLAVDAEAGIRERVEQLSHYYDRIQGVRVIVDMPQRRRQTDSRLYAVRIDLTVPGRELFVDRQPRAPLATALDGAFRAMRRQLEDYSRRQRGGVKAHEPPALGTITEYYPLAGYGFLEARDGDRVYFDSHAVCDDAFNLLGIGAAVRFTEELGEHGLQAASVAVVAPPHPSTAE